MRKLFELPLTLVLVCRVLRILRKVEAARRLQGPQEFIAVARESAIGCAPRSERWRRCLQRAIRWVDCSLSDGGNCYRRALLAMTLDPHAAEQPFFMGFFVKDRRLSGHAWLESNDTSPENYDFVIQL